MSIIDHIAKAIPAAPMIGPMTTNAIVGIYPHTLLWFRSPVKRRLVTNAFLAPSETRFLSLAGGCERPDGNAKSGYATDYAQNEYGFIKHSVTLCDVHVDTRRLFARAAIAIAIPATRVYG